MIRSVGGDAVQTELTEDVEDRVPDDVLAEKSRDRHRHHHSDLRACQSHHTHAHTHARTHAHTHTHTHGGGVVVSGVRRMNEVNARRARLVPGWVTVFGRVYHLVM